MSYRDLPRTAETPGQGLSPYSKQLTDLELASGIVLGRDPEALPLPEIDPKLDPLDALREAMVPFLEQRPCLVGFSGGRDSSAVLAVAADVARREGLEPPIPITLRFPGDSASNESSWQEAVLRHLQLHEWRVLEFDELDLVGPFAKRVLERYGVLWPTNAYTHLPLLEEAAGGGLLTGIDGDGLFGLWEWARAASVLAGRVRPTARDVLRVGFAFAPRPIRKRRLSARHRLELPWLTPEAYAAASQVLADWNAEEPFRWDRRTEWWAGGRFLGVMTRSYDLIAELAGARIGHPLLDRRFLAAVARRGGRFGFGDRTESMRSLVGGLLPETIVTRGSKAAFDAVIVGSQTRALVSQWRGGNLARDVVDESALREAWRNETPPGLTGGLVQAVWLDSRVRRLDDLEHRD